MCALTGEATALAGLAALLRARATSSGSRSTAAGTRSACRLRRSWPRSCASCWRSASLPAQVVVYERFQNQLAEVNYAPQPACGRPDRGRGTRQPRALDSAATTRTPTSRREFFGEDDTRSNMMRLVTERVTKIINVPNMKDHGATGCDRLPEEHRLRQLLERRAHPRARGHAHAVVRRHAGGGRAAALAHGAPDHGRPARRLARRALRAHAALPVPPTADPVRDRPGGDRPPAARRHRRQAQGGRRDLDLGPLAGIATLRRRRGARRGPEREHPDP